MMNLPDQEPRDPSEQELLSDEELDQRLKDPEFLRQLDEYRPPKAARKNQPRRQTLVWVTKSALMTFVVTAMMLLLAAAVIHRAPLGAESKMIFRSLGIVLGDSFWETVLLRTLTFGTLLKSVLTFLACLLYFSPNRKASFLAFWLLIPLSAAPEWVLGILGNIWTFFFPVASMRPFDWELLWLSSSGSIGSLAFVYAVLFLAGKALRALWKEEERGSPQNRA